MIGADRRLSLVLAGIVAPLVASTLVALIVLWPRPAHNSEQAGPPNLPGRVVAVTEQQCPPDPPDAQIGQVAMRCGTVDVKLTGGPDAGSVIMTQIPAGPGAPDVRVGDDVLVTEVVDPDNPSVRFYDIADNQRGTQLFVIVLIFAGATIIFARLRGLAALGGLAISFAVLLLFVVPDIMQARNPVLVAVVGSAAIMFAVLYLTHGINVNTTVAVLGTLVSLVITGVAATLAASATHLTGVTSEDDYDLALYYGTVDLRGLLLAGIIIGSLGVLDDVTVTQAVTVGELHAANPRMSRLQLFRSASRVGRAHIASVVNTLVLAYAGASLPLLLLIYAGGSHIGTIITGQLAAQEIVRSVVGSLGLISAVPITTGLAAMLTVTRASRPRPSRPRIGTDPTVAALVADRRSITTPWDDGI
ncbi:MAG TPA: YibE/F family protein [Micromonosporaceae bacterium]